jgi:hypothetical protein
LYTHDELVALGCDNAIILIGAALERDPAVLAEAHAGMDVMELRVTCSALAVHAAALLRTVDPDDPRQVLQDVAIQMAVHAAGGGE